MTAMVSWTTRPEPARWESRRQNFRFSSAWLLFDRLYKTAPPRGQKSICHQQDYLDTMSISFASDKVNTAAFFPKAGKSPRCSSPAAAPPKANPERIIKIKSDIDFLSSKHIINA